jgi:predicted aconitase with swiveling domain
MTNTPSARAILSGTAQGPAVATDEALSFWGGVDPATGHVIDVHHPLHGVCLTGAVLMMPSSRGSCSGSGILLDLILSGRGPAALIFSDAEDVLTLGALVASEMFGKPLPVARVSAEVFAELSKCPTLTISPDEIGCDTWSIQLAPPETGAPDLSSTDREMLEGSEGPAVRQAMRIICAMAAQQGATRLVDVTQGHIDGCIYASPANLTFAETASIGRRRVSRPRSAIRPPVWPTPMCAWAADPRLRVLPICWKARRRAARRSRGRNRMPSFSQTPFLEPGPRNIPIFWIFASR